MPTIPLAIPQHICENCQRPFKSRAALNGHKRACKPRPLVGSFAQYAAPPIAPPAPPAELSEAAPSCAELAQHSYAPAQPARAELPPAFQQPVPPVQQQPVQQVGLGDLQAAVAQQGHQLQQITYALNHNMAGAGSTAQGPFLHRVWHWYTSLNPAFQILVAVVVVKGTIELVTALSKNGSGEGGRSQVGGVVTHAAKKLIDRVLK